MSDYLTRLLRAHSLGTFRPGEVVTVEVLHDDDCTRPSGGPCTCRPEVHAKTPAGTRDISDDGTPQGGDA